MLLGQTAFIYTVQNHMYNILHSSIQPLNLGLYTVWSIYDVHTISKFDKLYSG